jgi:hypothetical protein
MWHRTIVCAIKNREWCRSQEVLWDSVSAFDQLSRRWFLHIHSFISALYFLHFSRFYPSTRQYGSSASATSTGINNLPNRIQWFQADSPQEPICFISWRLSHQPLRLWYHVWYQWGWLGHCIILNLSRLTYIHTWHLAPACASHYLDI